MPAITIDLVSSSPPPIPKERTKVANPIVTVRASSSKAPPRKDDGYLTLSDDDDPFPPSPPNVTIPSTFPSSKPNPQPKKNTKEKDDFLLSDDFEISRPAKAKPKPKQIINQKDDFYFLSDDFDSTINLDKSFANNEPSAKRRRFSSSPEPFLPKPPRARDFTRSVSNIESSKSKPPQKRPAQPIKRPKTAGPVLESDPLMFTSSPDPFEPKRNKENRARLETVEDEDEFGDLYSDDELPDIAEFASTAPRSQKEAKSALRKYKEAREAEKTGKPVPKPKAKATSSKSKASSAMTAEEKAEEKEARAREKAEAKEKRDAAKEAEKEEKRLTKEQQARDKALAVELAKVNTVKTDKKVSTPEMIIELSASIDPTLTAQINKFAQGINVDVKEFANIEPLVKWKRKVESRYNDELGYWESIPKQIRQEEHVLCLMRAAQFVELSLGDEGTDLDAHALKLKAQYPTFQIIYLIEGITAWMKKNKNTKKRQFDAAVRSHAEIPEEPTTNGRARKKKKEAGYVDEDMIEDALLRLQVVHGMLIHHTDVGVQSAEWVWIFTQYISTIPYKYVFSPPRNKNTFELFPSHH